MTEREPGFYWISFPGEPPSVARWSLGEHATYDPGWVVTGSEGTDNGEDIEVLSARLIPPAPAGEKTP